MNNAYGGKNIPEMCGLEKFSKNVLINTIPNTVRNMLKALSFIFFSFSNNFFSKVDIRFDWLIFK